MILAKSKFHFVGIGGIGMCGLAELLHRMGAQVSGSDMNESVTTEHLKNIGVRVEKGHRSENINDADVVVYSSAVPMKNPEIVAARARGIPLIPRAEALAEMMRLKRGIAVAGTHGKTTTTSMIAAILLETNLHPTIFVGGRLNLIQSTALLGEGEWLVAEADESDGSFHKLSPELAVITNIDADHLDHFKTFENLQNSFLQFANKIPFYGVIVVCGDDPRVRVLFENYTKRVWFYGFEKENDFILSGEKGTYELFEKKDAKLVSMGSFDVRVPGRHNALNAAASLLIATKIGVSFSEAAAGLRSFEGVERRFQLKGEAGGVKVYDDYGHHPTEVRATLQGFREAFPSQRIVVLFQPHRYSRTESCWSEFMACFSGCDELLLTDIYAAGEAPRPEISSERMTKEVQHQNAIYMPKSENLAKEVRARLKSGDIFVTLGAGDNWKMGMEVLACLK